MAIQFDENGFACSTDEIVLYHYGEYGDTLVYTGGELAIIAVGTSLPPNTTINPPPTHVPDGSNIFWNSKDNVWVIDIDNIGKEIYSIKTGESMTMTNRGPLPKDWTLEPYLGSDYRWSTVEGKWVLKPDVMNDRKLKDKLKERQDLLDKLLALITKCNLLLDAGVNVDLYTSIKNKYQEQLKIVVSTNVNQDPDIILPVVEDMVL